MWCRGKIQDEFWISLLTYFIKIFWRRQLCGEGKKYPVVPVSRSPFYSSDFKCMRKISESNRILCEQQEVVFYNFSECTFVSLYLLNLPSITTCRDRYASRISATNLHELYLYTFTTISRSVAYEADIQLDTFNFREKKPLLGLVHVSHLGYKEMEFIALSGEVENSHLGYKEKGIHSIFWRSGKWIEWAKCWLVQLLSTMLPFPPWTPNPSRCLVLIKWDIMQINFILYPLA